MSSLVKAVGVRRRASPGTYRSNPRSHAIRPRLGGGFLYQLGSYRVSFVEIAGLRLEAP